MNIKIFLTVFIMLAGLPAISFADKTDNTLNQTSWVLTKLNDHTVSAVIILNFKKDKISGIDSGCNRYYGSYTLNADKLSIKQPIASTLRNCPEIKSHITYIRALTDAVSYKIDAQQLIMFDASGKTLASFRNLWKR